MVREKALDAIEHALDDIKVNEKRMDYELAIVEKVCNKTFINCVLSCNDLVAQLLGAPCD